jgi:cell division protein FtsI (penicillin-binding protein 3)
MSGTVFKRIAEAIYSREGSAEPVNLDTASLSAGVPKVKCGLTEQSKYVLKKLNIHYADSLKGNWATPQWTSDRLVLKEQQIPNKTVPDVTGMGAKDAVYALENIGLRVNLMGQGEVYSQSLNVGVTASRGQTITIQLR